MIFYSDTLVCVMLVNYDFATAGIACGTSSYIQPPSLDTGLLDPRRWFMYSRTSLYGHLPNTDTSLLRTVFYVPTKFSNVFFKKTLYNTDPL